MKYSININQKAVVESGLQLDIIDMAIFDFIKDYTPIDPCKKMFHGGKTYFNVPYKKIVEELPLLGISTSDGIYRRFKKLETAGIIDMHPENAKMAQVWFCWGRNYQIMLFDTPGQETDASDLKPTKPAETTSNPRMKNRTPPDGKPEHYTILLEQFTFNNKEEAQKLWKRWRDYKKEQHRFVFKSDDSESSAIKHLFEISTGRAEIAAQIIEQSISNGWSGLFELKGPTKPKQQINGGSSADKFKEKQAF